MKRWLCAMLALCLTLTMLLCACRTETADEPPQDEATPAVSDNTYEPPPSPDGPLYEGTILADSPFVGTFRTVFCALDATSADEIYDEGEEPFIVIRDDGTFALTLDDRHGIGRVMVEGTVAVNGETATFTVTSGPRDDFMGGDVTEFSMKLRDSDVLRYLGAQMASTAEGDLFQREADEG